MVVPGGVGRNHKDLRAIPVARTAKSNNTECGHRADFKPRLKAVRRGKTRARRHARRDDAPRRFRLDAGGKAEESEARIL